MLPKVIYIMGPPGGGKGTQAQMLAQKIDYHRFSTGDTFRQVSAQDTKLGRQVKKTIDHGRLAPPEMAAEIVITAVRERALKGEGLVFDGTPRTMVEAEIVDAFFLEQGYGRPLVIYLNVDKEDMVARNAKRKFCLGIQGGFAVETSEEEQQCRTLGGFVGTRPDDQPEVFETRWNQFMELTYPVIEKYRQEGILHEVDGKLSIDQVHQQVLRVMERTNGAAQKT